MSLWFERWQGLRIVVKVYRSRKTGPEFKLLVVRCNYHEAHFTVYPPGYAPYSRERWIPVTEDGSFINDEAEEVSEEATAFEDTLFCAAIDGQRGEKWPVSLSPLDRESKEHPKGVFQTQKRRIKLFTELFGIEPDCSENLQLAAAAELDIPALSLRDYASTIRAGPTYLSRAREIKKILQNLQGKPRLLRRIYNLGNLFGFWGSVYVWTTPPV